MGDLANAPQRAAALAATGLDGLFTFEGNSDVFFPLVHATGLDVDLYTNVAIAFPRSPMHLAYQAWDLHRASGGRFALGLGTQIKPHIERRYSSTWGKPVERMVELIDVLHEIWDNWIDGAPLDHRGEFYRVDLMTPMFVPHELGHPRPEIWAGALGPRMTEAMAQHADGIVIHPFNTGAFLAERTLPMIDAGLAAGGKTREGFTLNVGCIANPCLTDEEYERASTAMRFNLAFYGSTPAYRVTLDHHGLGDLQPKLREVTKSGDWSTLGDLIDDEVLDLLAVRGTPAECAARLTAEYGGLADRLSLTVSTASDEALAEMLIALHPA
jgi:probable F420-dependent oxidoreductase